MMQQNLGMFTIFLIQVDTAGDVYTVLLVGVW